jgi:phosphocarrier protein HPr
MNSIRYRIVNPWGLHARSAAFIASVANTCANDWEVVAAVRDQEVDAKSIMSLMMLAASYDSEIEFLSLMPDENWNQFTASLESLFYVTDHKGNKVHAYGAVERVIKLTNKEGQLSCLSIQRDLEAESSKFDSAPFFERMEKSSHQGQDALPNSKPQGPGFDFENIHTFISYDSKDFSYAVRIYDALIGRAFNVFFAGASLPRTGTSDFQLAIEQALASTRSMVLVATDAAHLEGGWVRAEWTTFLNEHRAGRKAGNLVTVRPKRFAVSGLPLMLRMFQSEEMPEYGPLSSVRIDRLIKFLNFADKV